MSDNNVIKLAQPEAFTDSLTEILRSGARLERVTVPDIVVYGSDHVSGSAIQVVQPFTIYLAPLAQLEQADEKPLAKYPHADLELVFDLKLAKTKDGLELRLDFADLRGVLGVPVPSDLQQRVKDALSAALQATPLGYSLRRG